MDFDTEWDTKHKLFKVANYNEIVANQCLEYFKRFPENESWFLEELKELHWRNKFIGKYRNHISLTAIPLANKLYDQLEIITFPFVIRVACRGWDTAGGTWAWAMKQGADNRYLCTVGSADPVRYCLKKGIVFDISGNGEIYAGYPNNKGES